VSPEGVFRPFCQGRINFLGITDGTSNTIGVGEKNVCLQKLNAGTDLVDNRGYAWGWDLGTTSGNDNTVYTANGTSTPTAGVVPDLTASTNCGSSAAGGTHGYGSSHPGGMNALFMDGTVRFVRNVGSPSTLPPTLAATPRAGMNVISLLNHVSDNNPNPADY